MLRLLLVDDEINVLRALERSLQRSFGADELEFELCTEPLRALARCRETAFDIVISDYRMPAMDGVELLAAIRQLQPGGMRLMLSASSDFDVILKAVNTAGIARFICKPWSDTEVLDVLRQALAAGEPDQRLAALTPREHEVLDMLVGGQTNKAIARALGISPRTVENHRARVMEKTGAGSLPELVQLAVRK